MSADQEREWRLPGEEGEINYNHVFERARAEYGPSEPVAFADLSVILSMKENEIIRA